MSCEFDALRVADFDGDGKTDIVLGTWVGANYIFWNNGSDPWTKMALPGGSPETRSLDIGDLDGDGKIDIVYHAKGFPSKAILNYGNRNFGTPVGLRKSQLSFCDIFS